MTKAPGAGLTRLLRVTSLVEDGILVFLLAVMIALAITQILLRNFFGFGFSWADPLLRILVLWVGLAGAIVATRENNHISINVLSRYMPTQAKKIARTIVDLFACAVSAVIAYHAARFVQMEHEFGTVGFASVPAWVCELILPLAFAIIALRYLAFLLIDLKTIIKGGR